MTDTPRRRRLLALLEELHLPTWAAHYAAQSSEEQMVRDVDKLVAEREARVRAYRRRLQEIVDA